MATVQEVLAVRSYEGDAKAGGSFAQGITLDTTPFDKLAAYTVMQNKDLWERDNKKNDAAAKELAGFTALTINSTNPKIREYLEGKQSEIYELIKDGIPDYQTDKAKAIKYEKLKEEFKINRETAAQFDILKQAQVNKESALEGDDAKFSKQLTVGLENDWLKDGAEAALKNKPMVSFGFDPKYTDATIPEITSMITTKSYTIGNNNNIENKASFKSESQRWAAANMAVLNIQAAEFKGDPNSPTYEIDKLKYNLANSRVAREKATKASVDNSNVIIQDYLQKLKDNEALPVEQRKQIEVPNFVNEFEFVNDLNKQKNAIAEKQALRQEVKYVPIKMIDWRDGNVEAADLVYAQSYVKDKNNDILYEQDVTNTDTGTKNRAITENIKDNKSKNALEWYKAKAVNYGTKGNTIADKITEQGYNPIASIIASIGKVNTAVPLSSLSIAQVAALNPSYLTSDGTLTADAEKKNVSFGTNADGKYAIFELGENGKGKVAMSETKILSNASSYLSRSGPTGAAERKGQDAYSFTQNGFLDAIGSTAEKNNKKENSDNSAQKKWHFDSNYNVVYDK